MSSSDVAWKPRSLNICAAVDNTALRLGLALLFARGGLRPRRWLCQRTRAVRAGLGCHAGVEGESHGVSLVGVPGKS